MNSIFKIFVCTAVLFLINCKAKTKLVEETLSEPTSEILNAPYDEAGIGVFGRKVIYRDVVGVFRVIDQSGKIAIKICVNQAGIVDYAEVIPGETTIEDKTAVKNYLKAARKYKFEQDLKAPKIQCGKLRFTVSNKINGDLKAG
jgi:hypothetical protein